MSKKESRARRRLGQKISYLSLYEYAFIVDKHEEQMAQLKQKLSKMRRKLLEKEQDIETFRHEIHLLKAMIMKDKT